VTCAASLFPVNGEPLIEAHESADTAVTTTMFFAGLLIFLLPGLLGQGWPIRPLGVPQRSRPGGGFRPSYPARSLGPFGSGHGGECPRFGTATFSWLHTPAAAACVTGRLPATPASLFPNRQRAKMRPFVASARGRSVAAAIA
jgi:hypothetical protein